MVLGATGARRGAFSRALLPEEEASLGNVTAGELRPGQQGKHAMNKSSLEGVIRGQSSWDDSVRTAREPPVAHGTPEACSPGLT